MRWWLIGAIAGCGGHGGDGGGKPGPADTGSDGATSLECGGDTCDPASEFCLVSEQGTVVMATFCAASASCSGCDCVLGLDIEQIWQDAEDGTDNCSGATLYCAQDNAGITVTCQK